MPCIDTSEAAALTRETRGDEPDILFLALVGAAAFLSGVVCLSFGFAYDDFWTVVDNPYLRDPRALVGLLDGGALRKGAPDAGRPLMVAQHWLEWRFFGSRSSGYHVVSLLWHVACSVLVYLVTLRLWRRSLPALFAGVAFAVLPIHAEVVAVPSFREDSMMCAFFLASWLLVLRSRDRGGVWGWRLLSWMSFFAALASKEAAATLVVVAPLCTAAARRKGVWEELREGGAEYLGLLLTLGLAVAARGVVLGSIHPYSGPLYPHPGDLWGAPLYEKVLVAGHVFFQGVGQLFAFGWGQAPEYGDTLQTMGGFWGVLGVAFSLALGVWTVWALVRKRLSGVVAGVVFLALTFAPTSNLFWMPNFRADRFWYLPSVGFCLALGWGVGVLWERKKTGAWRVALGVVAGLFLVAQAVGLQLGLRVYKNDATLWLSAAKQAPNHHRALVGAAEVHLRRKRLQRAQELLSRAMVARPGYPPALHLQGRLRLAQERPAAAEESFRRAMEAGHWRPASCFLGLGRSLALQGRNQEAVTAFLKGLRKKPIESTRSSLLWELGRLCGGEDSRSLRIQSFAAALGVALWGVDPGEAHGGKGLYGQLPACHSPQSQVEEQTRN